MKFLLLLVLFAIVWLILAKKFSRPRQPLVPLRVPERMVTCLHCGVYLPESDSLADSLGHYCGEAHRQAGPAADK